MKINKLLLIFLTFIFMPCFIYAQSCDPSKITIESVELIDNIEEYHEPSDPPTIEDNTIKLNINFNEVGQSVKFKVVITNNSEDDFELSIDSDNSSYIKYELIDTQSIIPTNSSSEFYIKATYLNEIPEQEFENNGFNKINTVKMNFKFEDELVNPKTGNINYIKIILFIICVAIAAFVYLKNKQQVYFVFILFAFLLLVPTNVNSLCQICINIESNVNIPKYETRKLYNVVRSYSVDDSKPSEFVSNSEGIVFKEKASDTNGKGKYLLSSTKNDEYPVYYYRGNVTNNNVKFGGFCWKIVRTTSTGGTKLIYNGVYGENGCNNTGEASVVAKSIKFGVGNNKLGYFGYEMSAGHGFTSLVDSRVNNGVAFSKSVTYDGAYYVLDDDVYIKDDNFTASKDEVLKNHHYTCLKPVGERCEKVYYIYFSRDAAMGYVTLSNGETIEDVLNNDIINSSNENASNAKTYIDNWFSNNLTSYTDFLEDTVWCNDRSIYQKGGWDPNEVPSEKLTFGPYARTFILGKPSVECANYNDSFTVHEAYGNAKLTYPVGLLTLDEVNLAGMTWEDSTSDTYLNNGMVWWTMSPTLQSSTLVYIGVIHTIEDHIHATYTSSGCGAIRLSISIKNDIYIETGDGTADNPFIFEDLKS